MANYIGNEPLAGEFKRLDSIESQFNGSLTSFDLQYNSLTTSAGDASTLFVSLNGVMQEPLEAYTLSHGGSKVVFSAAPAAGDECYIVQMGAVGGTATPSDTSVTHDKFHATVGAIVPSTLGTAGQVLTVNSGATAATFTDAGGGADLYAANESSPSAQPSATGVNAIAIGELAVASGGRSLAIGRDAVASAGYALAIGTGSAGNGAHAVGNGSIAIGDSYSSGTESTAIAISTTSTSYGATGTNSVAIGFSAKATGLRAVAIGYEAQATHTSTFAIGPNSRATVTGAMALGNDANGAKYDSIAIGTRSYTRAIGHIAFGTGSLVSHGYAQSGMMVIHGRTADATQGALVSDSSLQSMGTPGSGSDSNQLQVPSYGAIAFDGMIVARGQGSASNTDSAAWKVEGLIRRENAASTTVLVNHVISTISNSPNWGIALSADTTKGALSVLVTGQASTNVKWVCTLRSSETVYNTY